MSRFLCDFSAISDPGRERSPNGPFYARTPALIAILDVGDLLGESTLSTIRGKRCGLTWAFVDQRGVEPLTSPVRAVRNPLTATRRGRRRLPYMLVRALLPCTGIHTHSRQFPEMMLGICWVQTWFGSASCSGCSPVPFGHSLSGDDRDNALIGRDGSDAVVSVWRPDDVRGGGVWTVEWDRGGDGLSGGSGRDDCRQEPGTGPVPPCVV